MLKKVISIVLLIVFTNFMVAPTIISMVDDTADVTLVFSLNEEENTEKESEKDLEIVIFQIENPSNSFMGYSPEISNLYKKNYTKYYLKLHLPPPELS